MSEQVRTFNTGATRSADTGKPDFEGYLSPRVIVAFGEYMTKHRLLPDGTTRASDNWQKGIPMDQYIKSMFRHFVQLWQIHRGLEAKDEKGNVVTPEDALMALLFNVQGYAHEWLKARQGMGKIESAPPVELSTMNFTEDPPSVPSPFEKYNGDWNVRSQGPGFIRVKDGVVTVPVKLPGIWQPPPTYDVVQTFVDNGDLVPNTWQPEVKVADKSTGCSACEPSVTSNPDMILRINGFIEEETGNALDTVFLNRLLALAERHNGIEQAVYDRTTKRLTVEFRDGTANLEHQL